MAIKLCSICFNETVEDLCDICVDEKRDKHIIGVVEKPAIILIMEKQGFNGRYHFLHGVMSPRDGIGPDQLKIRELVDRVWEQAIDELLFCLPNGQEGDATAMAIQQELTMAGLPGIKLTRATRGKNGSLSRADFDW